MKLIKHNLDFYQSIFVTDIKTLKSEKQGNFMYEKQDHFGNFLVETFKKGDDTYQLWRNHDDSIIQGESVIDIHYCGKLNKYNNEKIYSL